MRGITAVYPTSHAVAPIARALGLAIVLCVVSRALAAQTAFDSIDTSRGRCAVWTMPVGGSNFPQDAAYSRCALDRVPVLLPNAAMPAAPTVAAGAGGAGASYRLIINGDGSVDSALSRSMTLTIASAFTNAAFDFADQALLTIRRWRFAPAMRARRPVRSTVDLVMVTDQRAVDTLPAHLRWRHVSGEEYDSLIGHWVTDRPLPPFPPAQVDSAHAALVRQLATMGIVLPNAARRYCLAYGETTLRADPADEARLARLGRVLAPQVDTSPDRPCVDAADRVRLSLPRVRRIEGGGAMVETGGSHLPHWPFGFDARAWPRWRARCVGVVPDDAPATMECDVHPDVPPQELTDWYLAQRRELPRPPARRPTRDDEPVTLTVIARMSNGFLLDTLRATVRQVPRLDERAVRFPGPMCNRWSAWLPGDSSAIVLYGDFADPSLRVTRTNARVAPAERARPGCPALANGAPTLAAFMLGGIGSRPSAPVTLCIGNCARHYTVDPQRHLLAEQPHLEFSSASLREPSRSDRDALQFRVIVDPEPEGLVPLVIVDEPNAWAPAAWLMQDLGGGVWDWRVHYTDGWPSGRKVLIYLVRK